MGIIDRYAYANRMRSLDPIYKAGLALLVMLLCLLFNRPLVGLLALVWMVCIVTVWAGIPLLVFSRMVLVEGLFLVLSVVGVAVSLSSMPQPSAEWQWHIGSLWLASSQRGLDDALLLVSRALGATAAMNFLALTTPFVDLIDLLRRLRVPVLLIDLMAFMYRFIFVLLEAMEQMYTAQQSRLGYSTCWNSFKSAALLGSRLFVDAYQRSVRMQVALESRGYDGDLRVLPIVYRHDWHMAWVVMSVGVSLTMAWLWE